MKKGFQITRIAIKISITGTAYTKPSGYVLIEGISDFVLVNISG